MKISKSILFTGALALSLSLVSVCCSSEREEAERQEETDGGKGGLPTEAELDDIHNSDCLRGTRGDESSYERRIVLTKDNGILSCELQNYIANCGLTHFDIGMDVTRSKQGTDSVLIDVEPVLVGEKDCYCPYNVYFTVKGLGDDTFHLKCWWYEGVVSLKDGGQLVLEYDWASYE